MMTPLPTESHLDLLQHSIFLHCLQWFFVRRLTDLCGRSTVSSGERMWVILTENRYKIAYWRRLGTVSRWGPGRVSSQGSLCEIKSQQRKQRFTKTGLDTPMIGQSSVRAISLRGTSSLNRVKTLASKQVNFSTGQKSHLRRGQRH